MRTNDIIINHLAYCILKLTELKCCHLVILACSKTYVENAFLKIACITGCETAVRMLLPKKSAFRFTRIEPSGLLRLRKYLRSITYTVQNRRYRRSQWNAANNSL